MPLHILLRNVLFVTPVRLLTMPLFTLCAHSTSADPVCITSTYFDPDIHFYRIVDTLPVWKVVFPDGSSILVQLRRWGDVSMLDITITVSTLWFGDFGGLCGTNDGNSTNDLYGMYGNITGGA